MMVRRGLLAIGIVFILWHLPLSSQEIRWPDSFDVEWDSPSADCRGSMPLGNGQVAVNAWIEPDGSLWPYLARSDAWDEYGRLLKIGRVRIKLATSPDTSRNFRQRLQLRDATLLATWGEDDNRVSLQVWVDAQMPVVNVQINSSVASPVTATLELWRTAPTEIHHLEVSDVLLDRQHPEGRRGRLIARPDAVLEHFPGGIGWYHHNTESIGPMLTAKIQGLAEFSRPDPLLNRIFGAIVVAENGERINPHTLQSPLQKEHIFKIFVYTLYPSSPDEWLKTLLEIKKDYESVSLEERRKLHCEWWNDFWQRSFILISSTSVTAPAGLVPSNNHEIRVGWDQNGANRFMGEFGRLSVWSSALTDEKISAYAQGQPRRVISEAEALFSSVPTPGLVLANTAKAPFNEGLTIEAWVRPEKLPQGGGRIVDKITPNRNDGFLLDTHPGNSLRFIIGNQILAVRDCLPPGEWHHVAVTVDSRQNEIKLFLDGKIVAQKNVPVEDPAYIVSRGYCLQRFINACAGKGPYPIKFNGSLFNVAWPGREGDADYRRWGPGYWWQNTRLPYYTMCPAGDFDLMQPLFQMYAKDLVPLFRFRTRKYFNHGGLFIPECIYFWGDVFSDIYGWTPFEERGEDKLQTSRWHKWEWVSGLELSWLLLDYYDYTRDERFLKVIALPVINDVLTFFDEHYPTDDSGKLLMAPAQALETWWDCVNPMPEVAGLHAVVNRVLALPRELVGDDNHQRWETLRSKIPDLPLREVNGIKMLAPAAQFATKRNKENPELYAVFPFRLVSFEKPNCDLGRQALLHRLDRGHAGWRQDDVFMAYLGMAQEAREYVVARARERNTDSRFPAFWGPNYDWVPDQDHGSVLMIALQSMLLQKDGSKIFLFPAWPRDWNVRFKLWAPHRTTVTAEYRDGEVTLLEVKPLERQNDVIVCIK